MTVSIQRSNNCPLDLRYEITSELGRGAIGVVYLAHDVQLKRMVAIKRLRAGSDAKSDELQRMKSEALAIAQIKNPNIVQIFDVGRSDGIPFLVMEYCRGGSLAK